LFVAPAWQRQYASRRALETPGTWLTESHREANNRVVEVANRNDTVQRAERLRSCPANGASGAS
jgi:hypothetical protein